WFRITHARRGVRGDGDDDYGDIVMSFIDPARGMFERVMRAADPDPLTPAERATLEKRIAEVSPSTKAAVKDAFDAVTTSWPAFANDTREYAKGADFDKLVALGPDSLALVVDKMIDPELFGALVLFDRLATHPSFVIRYTAADPSRVEGEA